MQANHLRAIGVLLPDCDPAREHIAGVGSSPPELELDLLPELLLCVLQRAVLLGGGPVVGDAEVQFLERALSLKGILHFINKNYNNYVRISRR